MLKGETGTIYFDSEAGTAWAVVAFLVPQSLLCALALLSHDLLQSSFEAVFTALSPHELFEASVAQPDLSVFLVPSTFGSLSPEKLSV